MKSWYTYLCTRVSVAVVIAVILCCGTLPGASAQSIPTGHVHPHYGYIIDHNSLMNQNAWGKCLGTNGNYVGAPLLIWSCNQNNDQIWTQHAYSTGDSIENQNNLCLGINNGAPIVWSCNGNLDQQWDYMCVPNTGCAHMELRNVYTYQCLGVYEEATNNGAQVVLWDCNGNPDQQWRTV